MNIDNDEPSKVCPRCQDLFNDIKDLLAAQRQALRDEVLSRLDSLEAGIKQHTVPEGKGLVTRSYVLNSIEFERKAISTIFEGKE